MIVLDTSAVVAWLLRFEGYRHMDAVTDEGPDLLAPHILPAEFLHVLRRHVLNGSITADVAQQAIEDFDNLPIELFDIRPLAARIWQLRDNLTAYDASYVALAEATHSTLATRDARIAKAPGHSAHVLVIAD